MKSPHVPLTARPLPPASLVAELWRESPLRRTTYGILFFFGLAGWFLLFCLQQGREALLPWMGLGVLIGGVAAHAGSRRGPELGLVPIGGLLLMVALMALGLHGRFGKVFNAWLVVAGFAGGFFLLPLLAYVRQAVGTQRRALLAMGLLVA